MLHGSKSAPQIHRGNSCTSSALWMLRTQVDPRVRLCLPSSAPSSSRSIPRSSVPQSIPHSIPHSLRVLASLPPGPCVQPLGTTRHSPSAVGLPHRRHVRLAGHRPALSSGGALHPATHRCTVHALVEGAHHNHAGRQPTAASTSDGRGRSCWQGASCHRTRVRHAPACAQSPHCQLPPPKAHWASLCRSTPAAPTPRRSGEGSQRLVITEPISLHLERTSDARRCISGPPLCDGPNVTESACGPSAHPLQ